MDTDALTVFLEVADVGSFAAVAKRRHVDPSVISRSISGLEAQLGARLFQRTTRRMTITAEGRQFYLRVKPLLEELEDAREHLASGTDALEGDLRVTASVSFGAHWLVPRLRGFLQQHPSLDLDLQLSDAVLDLIEERVDLAIRLGKPAESSLVARKLMSVRYRVVAERGFADELEVAHPEDLAGPACIAMSLPGLRDQLNARTSTGETIHVPLRPRVLMNSAATVRTAMLEGLGFAVLPDWLIDGDLETNRCVDLLPDYEVAGTSFDSGVWLVYPVRRFLPARVRGFIEYLTGVAG